ncbi:MAG: hypothetical protein JXE07_04680 [Candidatus Aminicenantes bacterium]|nr:hypothetical protein [Candidatus Aminicenantes bacterium]
MAKTVLGFLSLLSLAACLVSAILHFRGRLPTSDFRLIFLLASATWFVFAALWSRSRR